MDMGLLSDEAGLTRKVKVTSRDLGNWVRVRKVVHSSRYNDSTKAKSFHSVSPKMVLRI